MRPSALAGAWYPGEASELAAFVDGALNAADGPRPEGKIRALIAPHAGYRYSGEIAAEVFALIRGGPFERVIVLAPSHRSPFHGLSIAEVDAYETPLGSVPLDAEAVARLRGSPLVGADPTAHAREHAIEIELPMLQRALPPGWRLVPILVGRLGGTDYRQAADLLRPLADEGTLIVVSSDFTHYGRRFGYLPFPPDEHTEAKIRALDEGAEELIRARDAQGLLDYQARTGITICGYRPIGVLLEMLPEGARVHRIAYGTSGDLTGDFSSSVSYLALAVTSPQALSMAPGAGPQEGGIRRDDELRILHRVAVLALERAVLGPSGQRDKDLGEALNDLPDGLQRPGGAFVTLKRDGHLRGCTGYIRPRKPLFQAVLENSVNAAINDRRFVPVTPSELGDLEIEVSVLSPPERITSYDEFRVGDQGIILAKDGRSAVFLPEVAVEQGWTREQTLQHLAAKAGLGSDAWRDGASFEVFSSRKYSAPYQPSSRSRRPGSDPVPSPDDHASSAGQGLQQSISLGQKPSQDAPGSSQRQ